jgi:hypothetical protein
MLNLGENGQSFPLPFSKHVVPRRYSTRNGQMAQVSPAILSQTFTADTPPRTGSNYFASTSRLCPLLASVPPTPKRSGYRYLCERITPNL